MNVRILSVFGIMAIMVAAWFFYQEEAQIKPATPSTPDMFYEVTKLTATQTNEHTGEAEYTLTADSLTQNAAGEDEMLDATMYWQPSKSEKYTIIAKRAVLDQMTGEMKLSDGFSLTREATDNKPKLVIEGGQLNGNTKTRLLSSDQPLKITNEQDSFKAKGMSANLELGEYEFYQIEMLYHAASR
ncbi:LPS export ABC transporter periplasmic protein LptC [Moraxella haemolytica]|uniref:LPS export ABC transporter periplasmic protein LptC n=1 Tax=Moraxella TaxID=475 RepID=UPI0025437B1B|nr:LPS export ABC transporter periplasmic protein LptC [Moraxella sp. ZY171148]WII94481.1 LPS export ABC transporter periplasmic protein LptC [Moraxella sp. ZY171148]